MRSLALAFRDSRAPRLLYRVNNVALRFIRPVTLGVRTLVLGGEDDVLLVRHSYRDGWYFPGGGVKKWETLEQAAIRETREEGGAEIEALDGLYGMYANFTRLKCDHVGLYVARRWRPVPLDSLEIVEARFFPMRDLPEGTTEPTRRRIAEFLGLSPRSGLW